MYLSQRFYRILWNNKEWYYDTKHEVLVFRYDHFLIEEVTIKMYKQFKAQLKQSKNQEQWIY